MCYIRAILDININFLFVYGYILLLKNSFKNLTGLY